MTKRQVRFFSKESGPAGWTGWFDISTVDAIDGLGAQISGLNFERVEVIEEMTRNEFNTQFLSHL